MEIKTNKVDDLNLELTLTIGNDDYADKRKKLLSDYRRKAEVKGFRKGMVPMSLVEKMYGHSALADSVNDVISESLNKYINENSLRVFGEPLPSESQPENDWTAGNEFTFIFDIGLFPELSFEVTDADRIPYYNIEVEDAAKKEMKDNMLKQEGSLADAEAAGEEDFIVVDFEQGETKVEGVYVAIRNVEEKIRKDRFIGLKPGETIEVDVNAAFPDETDRASMLKVKKEELAGLDPLYKMTVKSVKTFKNAELNQETFDRLFGEGKVKNEEEFDAMVAERLAAGYRQEADARLLRDVKDYYLEKSGITLPEKFIKRWLMATNEGKYTEEEVEKEFDGFIAGIKWQTVMDYIARKFDVKVEKEDLMSGAKALASYQFAMYGLYDVPEEHLDSYVQRLLDDENERRRIFDRVEEQKVIAVVREKVSLDNRNITMEKFKAL